MENEKDERPGAPVRLAMLLTNFRAGGAETQFWNLVSGLDRSQFDIHVLQIANKARKPTLRTHANARLVGFNAAGLYDLAAILRIARYVRDNGIQIMQSMLFLDNQIARLVGKLTGVPAITSIRGELRPIVGATKTRIELALQPLARKIVVNSHWLKRYMIEEGTREQRLEVIHNGIDIDNLQSQAKLLPPENIRNLDQGVPKIGIVARLHPMKDHICFFDAFSRIRGNIPGAKAWVIGGGPLETELRQHVTAIGLEEHVRFLGEINSGMGPLYKALDLLMLTSKWGESFPNVLLESMCVGTPVIATDVSAVSEIIDHDINGFVVPMSDSGSLAEHAVRILRDSALSDRLAAAGIEKAQRFRKERMCDRFARLYLRELGESK